MLQFKQLGEVIEHANLHGEWAQWQTLFKFNQAPQSLFHLAANGHSSFCLIDAWCGTRHAELCSVVQQAITEFDLSSLRSIHKHTARGAPVGHQFQENPLRGALSTSKQTDAAPLLATTLALLLLATSELNLKIPDDWTRRISGAAHNHASPEWAAFLKLVAPPPDSHVLQSVLTWGATLPSLLHSHRQHIRPTEEEFVGCIARLCTAISTSNISLQNIARRWERKVFLSDSTEPQEDSDEADLPEHPPRPLQLISAITSESVKAAESPEMVAVFEGRSVPDQEPPQADNIQKSDCIKTAFRSATDNQRIHYAWDNLAPVEIGTLVREIESGLKREDPAERIPALIIGLALCLGLRPKQIWTIPVSDGDKQGIDLRRGRYIKAVPRPPQSWGPDESRPCKLQPSAQTIALALPAAISKCLRKYTSRTHETQTLVEALGGEIDEGNSFIDNWLLKARQGTFRFTPRRIARVLYISAYTTSQRAVMAYWLASTESDPPPSGAYYISAPVSDVESAYTKAVESIWAEGSQSPRIASQMATPGFVGSRLIPPDEAIKDFVRNLAKQADAPSHFSSWEDIRRFHNAYTAYVVTMLMFATGHRPVDDPFDGHNSICPNLGSALIDDKNIGRERSTRLVPLAHSAADQFGCYREHLAGLYSLLPLACAPLKRQLESQLAHRSARILPLFFFIDRQGEWLSVTPSILAQFHPNDWHYPNRLHRHLLATWFYRNGINEEASSQMLGHIDVGTSALSPISPHSPSSLFDPLRKSLQAFLEHFGWLVKTGFPSPTAAGRPDPNVDRLNNDEPFGSERRLLNRMEEEREDQNVIRTLIADELNGASDASITQEHVQHLIDKVNSQTPLRSSRRGLARMIALREALADLNRQHGLRLKLPRLVQVIAHDESMFSRDSLALASHAKQLRSAYLTHLDEIRFPLSAQTHPVERAAHALFAFIAFARVLDPDVLSKILKGSPYWLIEDDTLGAFVEIQINEKNIRRYPIGTLALALLSQPCFTAERETEVLREFDRLVARLTGADLRKKYDALNKLIDRFLEEAKLDLPGYLFGYVSGSAGAVSLPRHAWLRYLTNKVPRREVLPQLHMPSVPLPNQGFSLDIDPPEVTEGCLYSAYDADKDSSRALSLDFVHWVDKELSRQWGVSTDNMGKTRAKNKAAIVPIASAVRKELSRRVSAGQLTPIASLLGRWLVRLCEVGSKRGAVVASTIATYWSTVSGPLAERAHEISLSSLQSDALEEVYSQILDDTDYKNPSLVLDRLKLFHWFISTEYGASDVDWTGVVPEGFPDREGPIDAGIITHAEYLRALQLLHQDPHTTELRDRLIHCACLIFVWRFGLRISEAAGIRRRDILGDLPSITLRVCNNEFRKVKTDAGLRLVPTVGRLDETELNILKVWLEHIDHCHPDDRLAGLFSDRDAGRTLISQWQLASRIADALKTVTDDPAARIHYGRHGFGSRGLIAMAMPDIDLNLAPFAPPNDARLDILGHASLSRRGPWAIATLIGHAFPGTTFRHYVHLHDLALAQSVRPTAEPTERQLMNALGAGERTIRSVRSTEFGDLTPQEITTRLTNTLQVRDCVDDLCHAPLPPPRTIANGKAPSKLELVLRILQAANENSRIENISRRLLLEPKFVRETLKHAAEICAETEYASPGELPAPQDLSLAEWRRLIDTSKKAKNKSLADNEVLHKAGTTWVRGYAPSTQMLLLTRPSELETIAALFKDFGLAQDRIMVRFDPGHVAESWSEEFAITAKQLGTQRVYSERIPFFPTAGRSLASRCRRVGISLREADDGFLRSSKVMHRFLLAVAVTSSL